MNDLAVRPLDAGRIPVIVASQLAMR